MSRLKTFGKYLLIFVGFYIFSSLLTMGFISTTYSQMEGKNYSNNGIIVNVEEAKSTFVNGYVKGKIENKSEEDFKAKYIKIEFISKNNNEILSQYIEIDKLKKGESKNFTINFRAENIKSFNVKVTDEYKEDSNMHLINLKDAENEEIKGISLFLATAIMLRYIIL